MYARLNRGDSARPSGFVHQILPPCGANGVACVSTRILKPLRSHCAYQKNRESDDYNPVWQGFPPLLKTTKRVSNLRGALLPRTRSARSCRLSTGRRFREPEAMRLWSWAWIAETVAACLSPPQGRNSWQLGTDARPTRGRTSSLRTWQGSGAGGRATVTSFAARRAGRSGKSRRCTTPARWCCRSSSWRPR